VFLVVEARVVDVPDIGRGGDDVVLADAATGPVSSLPDRRWRTLTASRSPPTARRTTARPQLPRRRARTPENRTRPPPSPAAVPDVSARRIGAGRPGTNLSPAVDRPYSTVPSL
jgi:hypothetical protein